MHTLVTVLGLLAFVPAGEEKIQLPTEPPPVFQLVSAVDADKETLTFLRVETVKVPVQVTEIVNLNGQQVAVARIVIQEASRTSQVTQSTKGMQIRTASGLAFKPAEGLKRIKPGTVVLVSSNGRDVSPAYLAIVQPETIVLIPSQAPAPLPPVVDPAPKRLPPPK